MTPVILDCDGVLLDWESGFRMWVQGVYPETRFTSDYPADWDLSKWIGCTQEQAFNLIRSFNQTSYFGALSPMPDAARLLYEIDRRGHPIYVVTSCSSDPVVLRRREQNLGRVFSIGIRRTICLDLGVSKLETLRAFRMIYGECIWVEDNLKNALDGFTAGHRSFFLRRPHNETQWELEKKGISPVNPIENLADLLSLI